MNWNNIFKNEKPINIYESDLFNEWLDVLTKNEHSKDVYRSYRDRLAEWIRDSGLTTLDTENAEKFLMWQGSKSGAKQANGRWSIFRRYCDWLILKGKLSYNPWEKCDLALCGCDKEAVSAEVAKQKMKRFEKLQKAAETEREPDAPRFTLYDVAELLMAIADNDEDAIINILSK